MTTNLRRFAILSLLLSAAPLRAADRQAEYSYQEGLKLERQKDYKLAIWNFRSAIKFDGSLKDAFRHAGNCSYYMKEYKEAVRYYDQYLEAAPGDKAVIDFRARVQSMMDHGADMPHGQVRWFQADEGLKEARRTGKPLMYDFTAAWCGPCRRLVAEVFDDAEFAALIDKEFVPVQVVDRRREKGYNPPDVQDLQEKFRMEAYPTLVVAMPDKGSYSTVGFAGAGPTMAFLVRSLAKAKGIPQSGYEARFPE